MVTAQEVSGLAVYLIGEYPTDKDIERFVRIDELGLCPIHDPLESALWKICLEFPSVFSMVDSVYAVFKPSNQFRKRLFFALSIFEMEPLHYHKFVQTNASWGALIKASLDVALYPISLIVGIILIISAACFLRVKCLIT
jgi:hypothetical protein